MAHQHKQNRPRHFTNPFIIGQIALLLGVLAVVVLFVPSMRRAHTEHDPVRDAPDGIERERSLSHCVAVAIAGIGSIVAVLGIWRERPPILGALGALLCVFVFCWHYILVGFQMFALVVLVITIILAILSPLTILSVFVPGKK